MAASGAAEVIGCHLDDGYQSSLGDLKVSPKVFSTSYAHKLLRLEAL